MRHFTLAIIIALLCASCTQAQNLTLLAEALPGFPACSLPAYYEALNNRSNSCSITNYYCQCILSRKGIEAQAGPKIIDACGTEAAEFLEAYDALCEDVELPTATSRRQTIYKPVSVPSLPAGWPSLYIPPSIPTKPPTIPPLYYPPPTRTSQLLSITDSSELTSTAPKSEPVSSNSNLPLTTSYTINSNSSTTTSPPSSTQENSNSSFSTNQESNEVSQKGSDPGLSAATKAGIGVGLGVGALLVSLVVCLICRKKRRKSPPLQVLRIPRDDGGEEWEKAELEGSAASGWRRFWLAPKHELAADKEKNELEASVNVAELENRQKIVELDGHAKPPAQLSQAEVSVLIDRSEAQSPSLENIHLQGPPTLDPSASVAGPLPATFDLYPIPQITSAAIEEDTDLDDQARILKKRQAMTAETKRLTEDEDHINVEEEALRRIKGAKAGRAKSL